jgi:hypothetical protein
MRLQRLAGLGCEPDRGQGREQAEGHCRGVSQGLGPGAAKRQVKRPTAALSASPLGSGQNPKKMPAVVTLARPITRAHGARQRPRLQGRWQVVVRSQMPKALQVTVGDCFMFPIQLLL